MIARDRLFNARTFMPTQWKEQLVQASKLLDAHNFDLDQFFAHGETDYGPRNI